MTILEQLQDWVDVAPEFRKVTIVLYGSDASVRLEDMQAPNGGAHAYRQSLYVAILAALEQAEGVKRG